MQGPHHNWAHNNNKDIELRHMHSICRYVDVICTLFFQIDKDDSLPKKLCGSCYNCLISFYDFRNLAEKIDNELHSRLAGNETEDQKNNEAQHLLIDIKIEHENSNLGNDYDNEPHCDDLGIKQEKFEHESKPYLCTICLSNYDNITELHKHLKTHNSCLECNICNKRFKKESKWMQHKLNHESKDIYSCQVCKDTFTNQIKYVKHLVKHGKDNKEIFSTEINQNGGKSVECEVCSAHFKSLNALAAHKRKHAKKGRILACSICGKIFKKVSHVKRHELCHEVNRPFKCSQCPKRFNTESLLNEHAERHNNVKPHECPLCLKTFAHVSTLTNHIKLHTRDKPFLCPTCGKKFDSSTNLNQHMRRHLGLKMFACNLCPRKFVSKGEF